MADELDDLVAGDLRIVEQLDVPDLWERIVTLADTEQSAPRRRPRRWWPALIAAAVVATVVVLGVVAWNRDTATHVDDSPSTAPPTVDPVNSDNIVHLEMRDDEVAVTPTATAGWVSFEVDNHTDHIRYFGISPLLPGKTMADVVAALRADRAGSTDAWAEITPEHPLVGGFNMGGNQHTIGAPVDAGDYVVVSTELDGDLQPVPATTHAHELRIAPGDAGQAPTPTLTYQFIGDTPIGETSTQAGRFTLALDDDPHAPHEILLINLPDGATQSAWDRWSPWNQTNPSPVDWNTAPADSLVGVWGTAPGRTLTLDLDPGPIILMGGVALDQMSYRSVANIQVN